MTNQFIFNSVTLIKTKNSATFKEYLSCLHRYWAGKNVDTIDNIGSILSESTNHPFKFNLYTLWIHCLERLDDHRSLHALAEHLRDRYDECEPDDKEALLWKALLGICLYTQGREADPTNTNDEISPSASQHEILLHYLRLAAMGKDQSPEILETAVNRIDDYFYIESLARNYYINGRHQDLLIVLNYASNLFEGSVLEHEFKLHMAYESHNYKGAWQYASQLSYRYPSNADFWYFKGVVATRLNHNDEAQVCFEKSRNLMPNYLLQEKRLMNMTLLTPTPKAKSVGENHCWMISLTTKQRYEFMDSSFKGGSKWKLVLGQKAQAGDLCFVTYASGKDRIKLLGVLEVVGEQEWHPMYGYFSNLALKAKLIPSIELATHALDIPEATADLAKTGVFTLDSAALDILINALQKHEDENLISQINKIEHKIDKMRMSS